MDISIIGTGYVGLVTGVGLAAHGHSVVCVDINPEIVIQLNSDKLPIYEKGLDMLFREARTTGKFKATADIAETINATEITIVAVGTPNVKGQINLQFIQRAIREIGEILRDKDRYHTVVVKSTILPGTTDSILLPILEKSSGKKLGEFGLGFNPEFLREGCAVEDFINPDRIVLGSDDEQSKEKLRALYSDWRVDLIEVNTRTAELIKYANNCLLATQISVVNEIANLAAAIGGIDALDVMRGVHLDQRWNPLTSDGHRVNPGILAYLIPGCGFGGSCFPKDVQALVSQGMQVGLHMHVLNAVLKTNREQPFQVVNILLKSLGELEGKKIAVLGLSFKPNTDDIRESPAFPIIRELLGRGALIAATDPVAYERAKNELPSSVAIYADWREAVRDADAIAVLTAWEQYSVIPPDKLKSLMKGCLVIDARNICRNLESSGYFEIHRMGFTPVDRESEKRAVDE